MQIRDLMIQAINLFQNNQLNDASIILDKILKKDSNNPDALRVYGDIFLVKREYLRAIEFYKKSLIYYPKQPLVFNNCGACFLNIKNFAQAEYYFDLALSEDPKNQEALFNKAYVCDLTNNLEKAIGFFQELIRVNPNFVDAYYKIISINLKLENYELAYKQLHDLFIKHPSAINGFFYQEKAFCAYKMGLLDEALKDVSIAIDKNPELAENYNNRGSIYNDLDKYDDALSDLNYAIKLKPDYSDAYMNIGLVNKKMKNFDKAFENFSIALNCDNNNYKVLINQAILNKEMHNYLAGLKIINELIDIHQSEAALSVRAEIFTSLKKYDLAIKDLTKAITLNPYKSDLYTNRGILYESIGEDSLALIDYRTISDREGNVSLLQKLSEAVLNLKNMNFEVGWKQYQVRKEMSKHSLAKINTSKPLWSGEKNLKRLYVSNEQGVGDQILFSSMLPEIMRRVKDIILSVDHRLKEVYERSFPNI
jgi:tetratricopeptide (TPR) repeat protein